MNHVLAIDPGQVSGWAVLTVEAHPGLIATGKVDFTRKLPWDKGKPKLVKSASNILDEINDLYFGNRGWNLIGSKMAIESQYLDERDDKKNVDSLIKLCRNAGRWAEAGAYHGLRVQWVPPITWITKELGKGLRSAQIVVMAKQRVDALYGPADRSEHENAAVLIGRYAAIEMFWVK